MIAPDTKFISACIREKAHEAGFDLYGFAPSAALTKNGVVLAEWARSGMNARMTWLSHDIEKRTDPGMLLPGARSVIVTGLNYYTERKQGGNGIPLISKYAYGVDYHNVIMDKLGRVIDCINDIHPGSTSKAFVDSAPVMEKPWAERAGLGWQGRHSVLINKTIGSFFFLGVIITDIELEYDVPSDEDHCGTCRSCIESCPVSAINDNRTIDARRCIAYHTIENKNPVPDDFRGKLQGFVFGCDICQDICPWNKIAKPHNTPEFEISPDLYRMNIDDWKNLQKPEFENLFKRSAIGRKKYDTFLKNVSIVTNGQSLEKNINPSGK